MQIQVRIQTCSQKFKGILISVIDNISIKTKNMSQLLSAMRGNAYHSAGGSAFIFLTSPSTGTVTVRFSKGAGDPMAFLLYMQSILISVWLRSHFQYATSWNGQEEAPALGWIYICNKLIYYSVIMRAAQLTEYSGVNITVSNKK